MKLVTREQWGARAPKTRQSISTVRGVGIHWVGPSQGKWSHDKCAGKVKGIQNFHMDSRGWADIAYSHLACPHGYIFEGRKWGTRTAANGTNDGNNYYHAICYLGGEGDPFTDAAKTAMREYILLHQSRYGNEVRPHSWFKATGCPGDVIRNWVETGYPAGGPTTSPACDDQIFKKGDSGPCVGEIQTLLVRHGYDVGTSGIDKVFGDDTHTAVWRFQRDNGLTSDAVVGPNTWEALRASLDPQSPVAPTPTTPESGGDDELANLSPEAQEFYEQMYKDLKRRDARPTSLGNVLDWLRALRASMLG